MCVRVDDEVVCACALAGMLTCACPQVRIMSGSARAISRYMSRGGYTPPTTAAAARGVYPFAAAIQFVARGATPPAVAVEV